VSVVEQEEPLVLQEDGDRVAESFKEAGVIAVKFTASVTDVGGYPLFEVAVMVAVLVVPGNSGPKLVWLDEMTT